MEEFQRKLELNLKDVSPTYSKAIKPLPKDLKEAVTIGIYVLRTNDAIEEFVDKNDQKRYFDLFFGGLEGKTISAIRLSSLLDSIDMDYQHKSVSGLVEATCFALQALPHETKQTIYQNAKAMAEGMMEPFDIITFEDQNRYCDIVAKTTGDMLTDLFYTTGHIGGGTHFNLMELSGSFGRAMQKMNIIKDIRDDINAGKHYWPKDLLDSNGINGSTIIDSRDFERFEFVKGMMLEDAKPYLESALEYIKLIPNSEGGIRKFLSFSLMYYSKIYDLAMQEGALFRDNLSLSKIEKMKLLLDVQLSSRNNGSLERMFRKYIA